MVQHIDNIIKSIEDKRQYRGLILPNELKVLLISDKATDHAVAALNVNVGNMSDPDELPGLAHFCEHMLFLGTKKYPIEGEFRKFILEHGGMFNASTGTHETKYRCQVSSAFLKDSLDRFAQFFIAPLFTESATEREVNAIHSEHLKNIPNDIRRQMVVNKFLSAPNHPYRKYGCGNKQTLWDIPKEKGIHTREALLKFHSQWYSSNIMTLVVLGQESLDDLTKLVEELFGAIENKKVEAPIRTDYPYTSDQFATITKVVPLREQRVLKICFPMPDLRGFYKSGPDRYLGFLCGNEGIGSLFYALKSRGWSTQLWAGALKEFAICTFVLHIDLTEEGLEHVRDIVKLVFQYLNMLKKEGPQQWIFNECSVINEIEFRYHEVESDLFHVYDLTSNLQMFPLEEALYGPYTMSEYNPDIINSILDNFTAEKVRMMVIAKIYETECTSTEPYLGVKYHSEKMSKQLLEEFQTAELCSELKLPEPNEFIPTDFSLLPLKCITPYPVIILDTPHLRLWFKQDSEYITPKVKINMLFATPLVNLDPLYFNLSYMFVKLLYDSLNEYSYSAQIAGLLWQIKATQQGIIITFSGFNNKMDILLNKVLVQMKHLKIDMNRFKVLHESYKRELRNFTMEQPFELTSYYLDMLLSESSWSKENLLETCKNVDVAGLEAFSCLLLTKLHVEILVQGNCDKSRAMEVAAFVEENFCLKLRTPLYAEQMLNDREYKLESGMQYMFNVDNMVHKSSCVSALYQCGADGTANNTLTELLRQILFGPCFGTLRTKEQLGYVVRCQTRQSNGTLGIRIVVQSERPPAYVDSRIEAFVEAMKSYLESMSFDDFERHKQSLTFKRLEKPKTLSNLVDSNWAEIISQQYHFDRDAVEMSYLKNISKDELISFFNDKIALNGPNRKKIAIYVTSKVEPDIQNQAIADYPIQEYKVITDAYSFKKGKELYPLPRPYIDYPNKGLSNI